MISDPSHGSSEGEWSLVFSFPLESSNMIGIIFHRCNSPLQEAGLRSCSAADPGL